MNRNHFWKLVLIVGALLWAISEIIPPTARPLIPHFRNRARGADETFKAIVQKADTLQQQRPDSPYENLVEAIGTNDITQYFPFFDAKEQLEPTSYILNRLQKEVAGKIRLGLDLQGGTAFVMRMDTNKLHEADGSNTVSGVTSSAALSQAIEVLRRRVDRFGVAEPVFQPQGEDRIIVQLPGLSETAMREAKTNLQKAAFLEFRLCYDERDSDELARSGALIPGYEILKSVKRLPGGKTVTTPVLVKRRPEMIGGIKSAGVVRGNLGQPKIIFELDSEHSDKFARITEQNMQRRLAIVLDGMLQTAPTIQATIVGNGEITGDYTVEEAFQIANILENPLKAPLILESSSEVDPTLGADSIRSGIKASVIGVVAVSAFMIVYYLLAGMVANVALLCNIVILIGVMCSVGTTLTLPGIAGIVLTVGMAVDANVLIFERLREELGKGKSLRGALAAGYDRAFGTIFDSHVTTLISSIILIFMGTGSVKGFGVALTIGVAASLFTALVITRLIFDWLIHKNIIKSLPMLHLIRDTKIDFMRWAVPAFIASWLIIVVGNSYGIFVRGSDVKGVEFSGGETITLAFNQQNKVDVDQLRKHASEVSKGEVLVAYQHNNSTALDTLRLTFRTGDHAQAGSEDIGARVVTELKKDFPAAEFKVLSTDRVGPTIGAEIQETAILASLLAMFGILIYVAFRYEFTFAVGAVVAIIHDILMTLGCYFLAGRELNSTTVAAVLTIIGFSINDTIVIFDRIREDLKLGVRGTFKEVINQALNQTLSRTIITSGTVFLATLSLLLFGGGPINDFAFTFLVGIITGTYSSIYIASTLVYILHKGQRPKIGSAQLTVETAAPAAAMARR